MSKKISYGGILLAMNMIFLIIINIIPMNTIFLMGLASLPISIIIMNYGPKSGFIFYLASLILSFIVLDNKFQWILYISTFAVYGLIKYLIEQDRNIYMEYILKLIFANAVVFFIYLILKPFLYIPINMFTIVIFEGLFIIYDHMYTLFIDYYNSKLSKIIKKI